MLRAASDAWPEFLRAELPPNVRLPERPISDRVFVLPAGEQVELLDALALDLPEAGRYVIHLRLGGERRSNITVRAA